MEEMRLFASNIKELQQERIGAPSCGRTGEDGTLQTLLPITQPHEGGWGEAEREEHFAQVIFSIFSLLDKHVKILL